MEKHSSWPQSTDDDFLFGINETSGNEDQGTTTTTAAATTVVNQHHETHQHHQGSSSLRDTAIEPPLVNLGTTSSLDEGAFSPSSFMHENNDGGDDDHSNQHNEEAARIQALNQLAKRKVEDLPPTVLPTSSSFASASAGGVGYFGSNVRSDFFAEGRMTSSNKTSGVPRPIGAHQDAGAVQQPHQQMPPRRSGNLATLAEVVGAVKPSSRSRLLSSVRPPAGGASTSAAVAPTSQPGGGPTSTTATTTVPGGSLEASQGRGRPSNLSGSPQQQQPPKYQWRPERKKSVSWTDDETSNFYKALRQFGTDFRLIAEYLPGRTRPDILAKYKIECKERRAAVEAALSPENSLPIDMDEFMQRKMEGARVTMIRDALPLGDDEQDMLDDMLQGGAAALGGGGKNTSAKLNDRKAHGGGAAAVKHHHATGQQQQQQITLKEENITTSTNDTSIQQSDKGKKTRKGQNATTTTTTTDGSIWSLGNVSLPSATSDIPLPKGAGSGGMQRKVPPHSAPGTTPGTTTTTATAAMGLPASSRGRGRGRGRGNSGPASMDDDTPIIPFLVERERIQTGAAAASVKSSSGNEVKNKKQLPSSSSPRSAASHTLRPPDGDAVRENDWTLNTPVDTSANLSKKRRKEKANGDTTTATTSTPNAAAIASQKGKVKGGDGEDEFSLGAVDDDAPLIPTLLDRMTTTMDYGNDDFFLQLEQQEGPQAAAVSSTAPINNTAASTKQERTKRGRENDRRALPDKTTTTTTTITTAAKDVKGSTLTPGDVQLSGDAKGVTKKDKKSNAKSEKNIKKKPPQEKKKKGPTSVNDDGKQGSILQQQQQDRTVAANATTDDTFDLVLETGEGTEDPFLYDNE